MLETPPPPNKKKRINVAIYMYKLNVVRIQLQLDQVITTSYNKLRYEVIYVGILLRNKNPLYYIQMYDIGG